MYGGITVKFWYKLILRTSEEKLKLMVDFYNQGLLPQKLRIALEMIDGLPLDD